MSVIEKEVLNGAEGAAEVTGGGEEAGAEVVVVETVSLSLKKSYTAELAHAIAKANEGVTMEETESSFKLTGLYIRVTREEVEKVAGALADSKWRVLFMNRNGLVKDFDNAVFSIGTPPKKAPDAEEAVSKETTQLNVRIDKTLKAEMETLRSLLPNTINQNLFVEEALREYVDSLKKELI